MGGAGCAKIQAGRTQHFDDGAVSAQRAFNQTTLQLRLKIVLRAKPAFKRMLLATLQIKHFHGVIMLGNQAGTVCQLNGQAPDKTFCSHNAPVKVLASVTAPLWHQASNSAGVAVKTSKNSPASS